MGCTCSVSSTGAIRISKIDSGLMDDIVSTNFGQSSAHLRAEIAKNYDIDRKLSQCHMEENRKVKLLLLGPGESGKSTIFKQMRILYGEVKRSDDDLRMYGVVVRSNTITAVRKLCSLLTKLELEEKLEEESLESLECTSSSPTNSNSNGVSSPLTPKNAFDILVGHLIDWTLSPDDLPTMDDRIEEDWVGRCPQAGLSANNDAKLFLHLWHEIKVLWESKTIQEAWPKRAKVNIIDSHKHFLDEINRIASPSYCPTDQDILFTRVKTSKVAKEQYHIEGVEFEVYDVGGQRSQRHKWVHCFDVVDAVIFTASLSEYDQTLAESRKTNRMVEAIELFQSVCHNRAFTDKPIMLFFTKRDVLQEKILYSNIADNTHFSDYAGPPKDYDAAVQYFIDKFMECLPDDDIPDSYIHVTTATDTNNMKFVLTSAQKIIMSSNLENSGFID